MQHTQERKTMGDVAWIDVEPVREGTVRVVIGARQELDAPEVDAYWFSHEHEMWLTGEAYLLRDFSFRKGEQLFEYTQTWELPYERNVYKFRYLGHDEEVWSDELVARYFEADGSPDSAQSGARRQGRKDSRIIGHTFVSSIMSLRLAQARTKPNLDFYHLGAESFLDPPIQRSRDKVLPVPNRKVLILYSESPFTSTDHELTLRKFESDEDGYLTTGNSRALMVASQLGTMDKGVLTPKPECIFVLVSDSWAELETRKNFLLSALKLENASMKERLVRLLTDGLIGDGGSLAPNIMVQLPDHPKVTLEIGFEAPCYYLPVKTRYHGRLAGILSRPYRGSNGTSLLHEIRKLPDVDAKSFYKVNYDFIYQQFMTDPEKQRVARQLIATLRAYWGQHPEDLDFTMRMRLPRYAKELQYALFLAVANEHIAADAQARSTEDLKELWQAVADDIEQLTPKVTALLTMGTFEHLRVDVAFPRGDHLLQQTRAFYSTFFEEEVQGPGPLDTSPDLVMQPRGNASTKIGRVAADLALQYFIKYHRAQRSKRKKALSSFQASFRAQLLHLGIYEDSADALLDAFQKDLIAGVKQSTAPGDALKSAVDHIANGTDPHGVRSTIEACMQEAAQKLLDLHNQYHTDFFFDPFKQYNLFKDYPQITKLIYNTHGIRLDPSKHPKGFWQPWISGKPDTDDYDAWTFGEYTVYRCGLAYSKRGVGIQTVATILNGVLFLAGLHLMALPQAAARSAAQQMTAATLRSKASSFFTKKTVEVIIGSTESLIQSAVTVGTGQIKVDIAYAKAIAGLDTLKKAKTSKTTLYFDAILGALDLSLNAYAGIAGQKKDLSWMNFKPWMAADSAFDAAFNQIVTKEMRKEARYIPSQVLGDAVQKRYRREVQDKVLEGTVKRGSKTFTYRVPDWHSGASTTRREVHQSLQKMVDIVNKLEPVRRGGKAMYSHALKEMTGKDPKKISVRTFLEAVYYEALLRSEVDGDMQLLNELEAPSQSLKDALETLEKESQN